jgi:hypothetical protein
MIDINYSLRVAYFNALKVLSVPVYYMALPNNLHPNNYIIFRSIINTDDSNKSCNQVITTITVEIHTKQDIMNQGVNSDTLGRDVYNVIYPNRTEHLSLDGAQIVNTEMLNDRTENFSLESGEMFISRYITFKHIIYQFSDIS